MIKITTNLSFYLQGAQYFCIRIRIFDTFNKDHVIFMD